MKNLHVPNPCSERWETMSSHEKGKFCSICDKCVIDFTQKKHQEIIAIIEEKQNERICGRFYINQLQTENSKFLNLKNQFLKHIPASYHNSRITLIVFSLFLFLISCSKSNTERIPITGDIKIEEDSTQKNDQFTIGEALIENDSAFNKKDSIK